METMAKQERLRGSRKHWKREGVNKRKSGYPRRTVRISCFIHHKTPSDLYWVQLPASSYSSRGISRDLNIEMGFRWKMRVSLSLGMEIGVRVRKQGIRSPYVNLRECASLPSSIIPFPHCKPSFTLQFALPSLVLSTVITETPIWLLVHLAPIKNDKDNVVLYLCQFKDITPLKQPLDDENNKGKNRTTKLNDIDDQMMIQP